MLYLSFQSKQCFYFKIHSLNNMDDVSWGTREVKQPEVIEESPEDKNEEVSNFLSKIVK